ncbi:unnamed protein product [Rotaria magnacalcarata]|uniref:RNA-binding protein 15B n=4 Tax=Rotaria magnacalcarata TaxID=392030 RepID=A0A816ZFN2_9BILA|nr:unnamed protein product [Rotaria magnacalcarata]CAF1460723.1 unnamed protein product [Rotaria magnacalcarata]CAF2059125.1 unnamed protein product [Rotaria magnacalcarata]CAF2204194.1 unnamed protein product [Rotaria magnacalcarata]CAF3981291.1 unnamed protein product [Rotaria magnacalcarata]
MSSPLVTGSGGGSRRARYSRSPSNSVPPSKRSKPSSSADGGSNSEQHRLYTSICVKNVNPKIPDLEVRELCSKKFSKYGTNSVKIYYKNQERVAFVNFTNCEDARKARHAKTGLIWENIQVVLEPVYYRRTVPAEQPLNPGSPRERSPPSPKRRPRRPSPSPPPPPPPPSSRGRHHHTSSPPRSRRHYSPYIPLPPDLADYATTKASRNRQGSSPSPPREQHRRRSRSRSISTSPVAYKAARGKYEDFSAGRAESNVQHEPTRTLFVGNLERDVRESKLKEVFGRYGTIEEIDLKVPQSSSKRAYAFIQYENMDMAYEARRAMDGHFIGKADCKIGYGKIVPTNCLWVGNIHIDIKRRELEQAFARYGKIKSFDFATGDPIAIVSYDEIEDAIKARAKMTGVTEIVDGHKVRTESGQSDSSRRPGLRIDYLDRPTARRFVIVRPQDNTTKRRTSRSSSASSASSARSSKERVRSVSNDQREAVNNKSVKRQSNSRSPSPINKRRTPTPPPVVDQHFYGPFGSYLSCDDTKNVNNINDLMTLYEKINLSLKSNIHLSTIYPVQFILKSHAYDARMYFLAGNPNLAKAVLGQPGDHKDKKTELKVTQRLRLDQHKFEELDGKLCENVADALSKANVNGQSSPSNDRKQVNPANRTRFAILITSSKTQNSNENSQRKSNGRANSPTHPSSSDETDDRSQLKKPIDDDDDDESSLSRLISYLAVKEAAGVITMPFNPSTSKDYDNSKGQDSATLNIYPTCQFSKKVLRVICPSIGFSNGPRTPPSRPTTLINDEHLMVVIQQND